MTKTYNFNLTAQGEKFEVKVDAKAKYGCWERNTGGEGGLWFAVEDGKLALQDFDGAYELPKEVASTLRGMGLVVGSDFDF